MKICLSLPLAEVTAGMRAAAAVVDAGGQVLVPAGAELSASMLHGLRRREMVEILVECDVEEDPAVREERLRRTTAQLDQAFRKAGNGAETRQLYQAVLAYRLAAGA